LEVDRKVLNFLLQKGQGRKRGSILPERATIGEYLRVQKKVKGKVRKE
jgi:hypothetical protein